LHGEGLQHQDGHSHVIAGTHPRIRAYDPAYAYEVATLIEHGLQRMYVEGHDEMVYLTLTNEPDEQPPRPEGVRDGIVRGMYRLRDATKSGEVRRAQILASGPMVRQALAAQQRLENDWGVTTTVWSVTSWTELYRDCARADRERRMHPEHELEDPWLTQCLGEEPGAIVTVSDHVKVLGHALARWMPSPPTVLGTDGFGRSDEREVLRDFFEVDDRWITWAVLQTLVAEDRYPANRLPAAAEALHLSLDKADPMRI
jgi:pyruvate dehydrogenase E1 component